MGKFKEEHGKTRAGMFLKSLGSIGDDIFNFVGDVTGIEAFEALGHAIGKNQEIKAEEKKLAYDLIKADMDDLRSAREANVDIQSSQHASWMAKNMPYIYDSFILFIWGFMTVYLVFRWIGIIENTAGIDMTGLLGIYSGVTGLATTVLAYHRGSSAGSEKKNNLLGLLKQK